MIPGEKRLISMAVMSRLVVGTLVCMLLMAAAALAVFVSVGHHAPNNYRNSSLPIGAVGDHQHFDCKDRTTGLNLAVAGTIATAVLTPLSWLFDPQLGVTEEAAWMRAAAARKQLDPTKSAANSREMTAEERELADLRGAKWHSERHEKEGQQREREKREVEEENLRRIWATYDADGSGGLDAAEIKAVGEAVAPLGKLREFRSAIARLVEEGGAGLGEEGITLPEFLAWWQEQGADAARNNFLPVDTGTRKVFWIGGFSPFDCGGKCGCCTDPQLLDSEDFYIDPAAAVPPNLKHSIDGPAFGMAVIEMNAAAERYTTPGLKQLYFWGVALAGGALGVGLINTCGGKPHLTSTLTSSVPHPHLILTIDDCPHQVRPVRWLMDPRPPVVRPAVDSYMLMTHQEWMLLQHMQKVASLPPMEAMTADSA